MNHELGITFDLLFILLLLILSSWFLFWLLILPAHKAAGIHQQSSSPV